VAGITFIAREEWCAYSRTIAGMSAERHHTYAGPAKRREVRNRCPRRTRRQVVARLQAQQRQAKRRERASFAGAPARVTVQREGRRTE